MGALGALLSAGRGGVSRGGGSAELIWGEESQGRSDLFKSQALSAAKYLDEEHIGLIGLSATTPEVKPEHESAGAAGVEGARGSTAWRRRLSPRHRRAVRGFFAPADEKETKKDE